MVPQRAGHPVGIDGHFEEINIRCGNDPSFLGVVFPKQCLYTEGFLR